MITTVTLNPALDVSGSLDRLSVGGTNRLRDVTFHPGGKGVNVSRMIQSLGGHSTATGLIGGATGETLLQLLTAEHIPCDFVTTASPTRQNLKVLDKTGDLTEFNTPGGCVTAHEMELLLAKLLCRGRQGSIFVLSGGLPYDAAPDTYRQMVAALKNTRSTVFLDACGGALAESLLAGGVDLLKVNRAEFCELLQDQNAAEHTILAGAKELCTRGIRLVVVTFGAEGALFVTAADAFRVAVPVVKTGSAVGAGDCMMAVLAHGTETDMPFDLLLRRAAATATASAGLPAGVFPTLEQIEDVLPNIQVTHA